MLLLPAQPHASLSSDAAPTSQANPPDQLSQCVQLLLIQRAVIAAVVVDAVGAQQPAAEHAGAVERAHSLPCNVQVRPALRCRRCRRLVEGALAGVIDQLVGLPLGVGAGAVQQHLAQECHHAVGGLQTGSVSCAMSAVAWCIGVGMPSHSHECKRRPLSGVTAPLLARSLLERPSTAAAHEANLLTLFHGTLPVRACRRWTAACTLPPLSAISFAALANTEARTHLPSSFLDPCLQMCSVDSRKQTEYRRTCV